MSVTQTKKVLEMIDDGVGIQVIEQLPSRIEPGSACNGISHPIWQQVWFQVWRSIMDQIDEQVGHEIHE